MESGVELIIGGIILILIGFVFYPVYNALANITPSSPSFTWISIVLIAFGVVLIILGAIKSAHEIGGYLSR